MNIQFHCKNIASYDPEKGGYVYCDAPLEAGRDKIGMRVKCPKCQQYAEVPMDSTESGRTNEGSQTSNSIEDSEDMDLLDENMERMVAAQNEVTQTVAKTASESLGQSNQAATTTAPPVSPAKRTHEDTNPIPLSGSVSGQQPAGMVASSFPTTTGQLQYNSFDQGRVCPICGGLLAHTGQCTSCQFGNGRNVGGKKQVPVKMMDVKPAGFTGWVQSWLTNEITIKQLALGINLLAGVVGIFLCLAAIAIGGSFGLLLAMLLAPFFALFIAATWFWVKQNTQPMVPLAFWQKPIWYWMLVMGRARNWSRSGDVIVDYCEQPLADHNLLKLPNISKAEVLDFENTQITDVGISRLHGLKNARVIILRNNDLSEEAVFRLQQALPKAWIWH